MNSIINLHKTYLLWQSLYNLLCKNKQEFALKIEGKPQRVKLKEDLTRYGEGLVKGIKGVTIPNVNFSIWGKTDRFVAVKFDNGLKLDVLYKHLDFINGIIEWTPQYD